MTNPNPSDPHSQLRTTSQRCELHGRHLPESHINHRHHVWPLGDGGPDISDNIIVICPTGHMNVHDLVSHYKMLMGEVPYTILRTYSFEERRVAKLGYDRLTRKSM
jgi:hypothetical protein